MSMMLDPTVDETPSHPGELYAASGSREDDPLDPIEGATTRMEMPPSRETTREQPADEAEPDPFATNTAPQDKPFATNTDPDSMFAKTATQDRLPDPEKPFASHFAEHDRDAMFAKTATQKQLPDPETAAEAEGPSTAPHAAIEDAPSWANEVPSHLEMIDQLPSAPARPQEDYSQAWDTRPPPELAPPEASSSVFEALEAAAQREVVEEPVGATTWKPTKDGAITDLDLSERAKLLQDANAETRPFIDKKPIVILGRPITEEAAIVKAPERVLIESSPAGVLHAELAAAPAIAPPTSTAEMMPEEATLAGSPPPGMEEALARPAPMNRVSEKLAPEQLPDDPDKVEDPSETVAGPLTPAPDSGSRVTLDEAPTWSPESKPKHETRAMVQAAREASAAALARRREASSRAADLRAPADEGGVLGTARRAPKVSADAAIVEEALGSRYRYLITVAFAILGLLAGIATALLS